MKKLHRITVAALALAASSTSFAAGEATNVIFFLGDGMGPTTVTASRIYKYGETGQLAMESLRRTARIKTYSNDAQTTDSAPSMAAYMTGVKMNNEVLSMSQDTKAYNGTKPYYSGADSTCPATGNGTSVPTLLELAKAKEITNKAMKSLNDLAGVGDQDIARMADSIREKLDQESARAEIAASNLDNQMDELLGKQVVAIINFPPKQIGPLMSECLVTGFPDEQGHVALCVPDRPVPLGAKLF